MLAKAVIAEVRGCRLLIFVLMAQVGLCTTESTAACVCPVSCILKKVSKCVSTRAAIFAGIIIPTRKRDNTLILNR